MSLLAGKVAVVTGAGRGIGRAHALALAAAGASVVVNDIGLELSGGEGGKGLDHTAAPAPVAEQVAAEIRDLGGKAVADTTGIDSIASGKSLIETAVAAFGDVDIVVNNAGIWNETTSLDLDDQRFDAEFGVHVKGTMGTLSAAANHMRDRGHGGRIINTIAGFYGGTSGTAVYCSAKQAAASITATAAVELAPLGITVNGISPLAITRQSRKHFFASGAVAADDHATIEHLGAHQNSPLVVFLASPAAADITGKFFALGPERFTADSAILLWEMWWQEGKPLAAPTWDVDTLSQRVPDLTR